MTFSIDYARYRVRSILRTGFYFAQGIYFGADALARATASLSVAALNSAQVTWIQQSVVCVLVVKVAGWLVRRHFGWDAVPDLVREALGRGTRPEHPVPGSDPVTEAVVPVQEWLIVP